MVAKEQLTMRAAIGYKICFWLYENSAQRNRDEQQYVCSLLDTCESVVENLFAD